MEYLIIGLVALVASCLTFFSGFGLGTLLLPVFALFFPLEVAVALTAIVHFLNNVFKISLVVKNADKSIILRFGIPAVVASFLGAYILVFLSKVSPIFNYSALGSIRSITPIKLVLAVLIISFALVEILPFFERLKFGKRYLPFGGLFSGFFGGLSGHQGALRSAFLAKCGLSKESFIGTGVVIALLVDTSRLIVYTTDLSTKIVKDNVLILVVATLSAFLGAYIGNKLLKKMTFRIIQWIVSILLLLIAIGLGTGFL